MGRMNTNQERLQTLAWGQAFKGIRRVLKGQISASVIKRTFQSELNNYFALSCLSRHLSESRELVGEANRIVFQVRRDIEESMFRSISHALLQTPEAIGILFSGRMFGRSNKQGTSFRMPLTTCQPTPYCASACYAHDALDAAPYPVIRGVINWIIASLFESGDEDMKRDIMKGILPHLRRAVRDAHAELSRLPEGFTRRANIRFAHVGEIIPYPNFANTLAREIKSVSQGSVDCVVYTRHVRAAELDKNLWTVNFTLDETSLARRKWAPQWARIVYSAFGGTISSDADVNFLEHHRWAHLPHKKGTGRICPATLPETKVRSCDAVRCARCFSPINLVNSSSRG